MAVQVAENFPTALLQKYIKRFFWFQNIVFFWSRVINGTNENLEFRHIRLSE